ncbi:MAG: coproporphyrinogen III oxidase [Syntrophaceae bacterium PtaU1.Bin231]|nr:MAG: coproporphyrinogen III oxidase [Syntrophaceae bacterium PtaU1.Bin231]
MKYEGPIIRPPSEAESLLLQVTVGCSHNRCIFCSSFKDKRFRIKALAEIEEDIREAACYPWVERVFLCDGDALIIPQQRLLKILELIRTHLPSVKRIGLYGNAKSIRKKSVAELISLRERGLRIIYLGVETGNEELLRLIHKGAGYGEMVDAGRRVKEAGICLSVTVLLGIGGRDRSTAHAEDTGRILTDMDPDYVGALTVMVIPGTPLHDAASRGAFALPDRFGLLRELETIISASDFTDCFFASNHASNYLPIRANLPREKDRILAFIRRVVEERRDDVLRSELLRAL